jgi:hypothetical protein
MLDAERLKKVGCIGLFFSSPDIPAIGSVFRKDSEAIYGYKMESLQSYSQARPFRRRRKIRSMAHADFLLTGI